jgi:hypothetical protein
MPLVLFNIKIAFPWEPCAMVTAIYFLLGFLFNIIYHLLFLSIVSHYYMIEGWLIINGQFRTTSIYQ